MAKPWQNQLKGEVLLVQEIFYLLLMEEIVYQPAYIKPFNKIGVNNMIFTISTGATGAGFLPSTVSHTSQKKGPEAMVFDSTFFFLQLDCLTLKQMICNNLL